MGERETVLYKCKWCGLQSVSDDDVCCDKFDLPYCDHIDDVNRDKAAEWDVFAKIMDCIDTIGVDEFQKEDCRRYIAAAIKAAREQAIPDTMDTELEDILGTPNFVAGPRAELLRRRLNMDIPHKSEVEQAVVAFWSLKLYLKHGADKWREEASKLFKEAAPPQEQRP